MGRSGMRIGALKGDITKLACDAIVNAANETLLGGGGVDGAIHRAAGPGLVEECATLGGAQTGEAKITRAYRLPCRYVIHAVGPVWDGGAFGEDALLAACYRNSMALARAYSLHSIAFCAISTGIYGFPADRAAQLAVDTLRRERAGTVESVILVAFDDPTFRLYCSALGL